MDVAQGGCLCSAVRYRVSGAPVATGTCHCNTCRKASAAPSVAWVTFRRSNFQVTTGEPTVFRSSPGVERTFCSRCGTPLTYANEADPDTIDVTTGSLDDPSLYPPSKEVWLEHKLAWSASDAAIPRHLQGSTSPRL